MRGPRGSQRVEAPRPKALHARPSVGKKPNVGRPNRGQ